MRYWCKFIKINCEVLHREGQGNTQQKFASELLMQRRYPRLCGGAIRLIGYDREWEDEGEGRGERHGGREEGHGGKKRGERGDRGESRERERRGRGGREVKEKGRL